LDNASHDGTGDEVRQRFPNIKLLCMPKNYGDWEGRDIALANAGGEYVFCMDDDAWIDHDVIATLVARMQSEPELAVIQPTVCDPIKNITYGGVNLDKEHYCANFLGGAAMYRASDLRAAGGFPHYLLGGTELHLVFRFLDRDKRILYTPQTRVYHVQSVHSRIPRQRLYLSSLQRIRAFMRHCPGGFRAYAELVVKICSHCAALVKKGFFFHVPYDVATLLWHGIRARRLGPRVRPESLHRIDWLMTNVVTTKAEYLSADMSRSYLWPRLVSKFKAGKLIDVRWT
jgi:GT2 family glycosyltransferase